MQEENIIDAAVEDKKTVTELAVANHNEKISPNEEPSSVIASVPENSKCMDADEFDPYFNFSHNIIELYSLKHYQHTILFLIHIDVKNCCRPRNLVFLHILWYLIHSHHSL